MIAGSFTRTQLAQQTPFDNSSNGFIATEVQTAIEEAKLTGGTQRFSITFINNGTLTNNQRVGYSDALPTTPVIIPKNAILKEITFANSGTNADARFDIYRRPTPLASATPGGTAVLLQQWTITNSLTGLLSGLNFSFSAGQEILIVFIDTGDNPTDTAMMLFFQAT